MTIAGTARRALQDEPDSIRSCAVKVSDAGFNINVRGGGPRESRSKEGSVRGRPKGAKDKAPRKKRAPKPVGVGVSVARKTTDNPAKRKMRSKEKEKSKEKKKVRLPITRRMAREEEKKKMK